MKMNMPLLNIALQGYVACHLNVGERSKVAAAIQRGPAKIYAAALRAFGSKPCSTVAGDVLEVEKWLTTWPSTLLAQALWYSGGKTLPGDEPAYKPIRLPRTVPVLSEYSTVATTLMLMRYWLWDKAVE